MGILQAMRSVEGAADRGALVTPHAIRSLTGLSKVEFDARAMRMARDQTICLHEHDYPASLSQAELDQLITDGTTFYIGLAIRQN